MVTQNSKQKKLSIFTVMRGKLAMLTLGTNVAGYNKRGKIRTKERNPANLIPSVMEVAAGKETNYWFLK